MAYNTTATLDKINCNDYVANVNTDLDEILGQKLYRLLGRENQSVQDG